MKRNQFKHIIIFICCFIVLAGCGSIPGNAVPPQETVPVVQEAVDRYVLTHQAPPVKPSDANAGQYEKFPIDFRLLMNTLQLSETPSNAYENGGPYYYVLLENEGSWKVKLIDMNLWQSVNDIQADVTRYIERNGRLPAGAAVADQLYRLDARALGLDEDQMRSVYSPQMLPLLVTENGTVAIDYSFEIMRAIQSLGEQFEPSDDLRSVLLDQSFMLPIHSLPYTWENDQPVIRFN